MTKCARVCIGLVIFCVLCPRGLLVVLYVQTRCLCCARTRHPYKRVCQVSRFAHGWILWRSRNVAPLSAEFVQCVRGGLRSMSFAGDLGIKQLRETQQKKSRRLYVVREVHAKY